MNLSDTLRGLLRRWYVIAAGVLVAAVAGYFAWTHTPPKYERSASQLLIPGKGLMPTDSPNPYLYIGSLTQAADVVVRVVGSDSNASRMITKNPGTQIVVERDPTNSGPVVLITVTATSDDTAATVLKSMVAQTATELTQLQDDEGVAAKNRISVETLTVDQHPTLQQKDRLVLTGGSAIGIVAISMVIASLLDGLLRIRSRRQAARDADEDSDPVPQSDPAIARRPDDAEAQATTDAGRPRRLQAVNETPRLDTHGEGDTQITSATDSSDTDGKHDSELVESARRR